MSTTYSRSELLRLITFATQLGFWDDLRHWKRLLAEMDAEPTDSQEGSTT